jgi:hypothetical protein
MIPKNPCLFRVYTVAGEPADHVVVLTIGKPRPGLGGWICRIRIHGIPKGRATVGGEDPLQAMQLALVRARRMLDASGLPLLHYVDSAPGDVGIPLPAPDTHGFEFQRRLERYMARECKRLDDAVAAFIKEKERRRAAKVRRAGEKERLRVRKGGATAPALDAVAPEGGTSGTGSQT